MELRNSVTLNSVLGGYTARAVLAVFCHVYATLWSYDGKGNIEPFKSKQRIKEADMYVVALNGSARREKGVTTTLTTALLSGMQEEGAEVELLYLRQMEIEPCHGHFDCWYKSPGHCSVDDDMQRLYPRLRTADCWVIGAPVYMNGMPGPMKNMFDRLLPFVEPTVELYEGRVRHPLSVGVKGGHLILVSVCGHWGMENFDPLLGFMRAYCISAHRSFTGALLRPHAAEFAQLLKNGGGEDIVSAAHEAGRQFVRNGGLPADKLAAISRPLLTREEYVAGVNQRMAERMTAERRMAA